MSAEHIAHLESFGISLAETAGAIKNKAELIKSGIPLLQEADADDKKHLEQLAETLETLQGHLELTSEILKSSSDEEIVTLRQKSKKIGEAYAGIKSKDDLNTVILQYALDYLNGHFLKKVSTKFEEYFVQDGEGKKSYLKKEFNSSWIQIMTHRTELMIEFYRRFAPYHKNDLFSQLKSSEEWKEVSKFVTFKKDYTPEELQSSNKKLFGLLHMLYAIVQNRTEGIEKPDFSSRISLVREAMSYKGKTEKAETQTFLYLRDPNEHAFRVFHFSAFPIMTKILSWKLPAIGCDQYIYVPRLFPQITKEVIQKEYRDKTINALSTETFEKPDLISKRDEVFRELFNEKEDKVGIRITAPEFLESFNTGIFGSFFRKVKGVFSKAPKVETDPEGIVIYIHGGGFATANTASYRPLQYHWTNTLKMVHFSLEYRLSPANKYPDALDDIWQAYLWIVNYAETILGIKTKKIILAGDSAGGNLVTALTLRLIRAGLRVPDGCFLIYPCLQIDEEFTSPSFLRSIDDNILPANLLKLFTNAYLPDYAQPLTDPFLSPLAADDELLKRLPPIRIAVGDRDPLHDQSWEFMRRLVKLNKDVKTIVYEGAIHGFYGFTENIYFNDMTKDGISMVRELIHNE